MGSLAYGDVFSEGHCDGCIAVRPQSATKHQEIGVYLHIRLQKKMVGIYNGVEQFF